MEIHRETNESLEHTVDDQEKENVRLKQRIDKIEVALSPHPLFVERLAIVQAIEESSGQACNINKVANLLSRIKSFVEEEIKARTYLNLEAFDILENVHKIGTHLRTFKEFLTADMNRAEKIYLNHVSTFVMKDL